jgi:hypothetical protein
MVGIPPLSNLNDVKHPAAWATHPQAADWPSTGTSRKAGPAPARSSIPRPYRSLIARRAASRQAHEKVLGPVAESLSAKRGAACRMCEEVKRPVRVRVARAYKEHSVLGVHVSHRGCAPLAGRAAERLDLTEASGL